jgi:hypothetical protein
MTDQISIRHERKWIITIERIGEVWPIVDRPKTQYETREERVEPTEIQATFNAGKLEFGVQVRGPRHLKSGNLGRQATIHFSSRFEHIPEWILEKIKAARVKYGIADDEALLMAQRKVAL